MNYGYSVESTSPAQIKRQHAEMASLQAGPGSVPGSKPERAPSEIATELQHLHEALDRLSSTIIEMGDRLAPVSLSQTACNASDQKAPMPLLCQTATSITNARGMVEGLTNRLREQIDALRC